MTSLMKACLHAMRGAKSCGRHMDQHGDAILYAYWMVTACDECAMSIISFIADTLLDPTAQAYDAGTLRGWGVDEPFRAQRKALDSDEQWREE